MASEKPLPDRCSAEVRDKVGLEITLDNGAIISDSNIDAIKLEKQHAQTTTRVHSEPNYESVREYLWDDYETTAIAIPGGLENAPIELTDDIKHGVTEPDTTVGDIPEPSASTHVWLQLGDNIIDVTNRTSELVGYCERYPMRDEDHGRCYHHQGGGAPKGNTNGMRHGMYAQRTNFYQALSRDDQEYIEALVDSWIEQAPFDRDNVAMVNELYRCGVDQVRAWSGIDEFVDEETDEIDGLVTEQTVFDGEEVHEVEEEHPANLPYSRLDRDIQSKLKDLGVYGESPEDKQASATESLAQKLSGLSDE